MSANRSGVMEDNRWNRFWFGSPPAERSLKWVRIGMAAIAFWFFASHWADVVLWFGSDGVLARVPLSRFLEDADLGPVVGWRLSPLYWFDSPWLLRGYLLVGMGLAVASVAVRQTRAVTVLLWLWCVWLANRALLVTGLEELALGFGLAYLAIAPADDSPHWSGSLARRLLQTHVSFLIFATGLTMLSALAWWDGSGVMALVAPVEMRHIDWVETLSEPWLHEFLSHAIPAAALILPPLLWIPETRRGAWIGVLVWCVVLALLSSHLMYFAAVGVTATIFRDTEATPRA